VSRQSGKIRKVGGGGWNCLAVSRCDKFIGGKTPECRGVASHVRSKEFLDFS
jgi:hypothetical protein